MAKAHKGMFHIQMCFTLRSLHGIYQDVLKGFPLVLVSVIMYLSFLFYFILSMQKYVPKGKMRLQ